MEKPPERHPTASAIAWLADRLSLPNEPGMQDWEFEVVDPNDLDKYLALFAEVTDEDVRFTLADMIIQAFDDLGDDLDADSRWMPFLKELKKSPQLHAHQAWYWSTWDCSLDESWNVAPYMRSMAERIC